jgi:hypothetical protein
MYCQQRHLFLRCPLDKLTGFSSEHRAGYQLQPAFNMQACPFLRTVGSIKKFSAPISGWEQSVL